MSTKVFEEPNEGNLAEKVKKELKDSVLPEGVRENFVEPLEKYRNLDNLQNIC